jgi:antitoxin component YwqK of YwqJK toxin-antitoxin module
MNLKNIQIDHGDGVYPPDNYTGEWKYHWPNLLLKYHAHFVNGKTQGEVLCYWDNGQVAQQGFSEMGICRGVWTDYNEDGSKSKETAYQDNVSFTVRFFLPSGVISGYQLWQDGVLINENNV